MPFSTKFQLKKITYNPFKTQTNKNYVVQPLPDCLRYSLTSIYLPENDDWLPSPSSLTMLGHVSFLKDVSKWINVRLIIFIWLDLLSQLLKSAQSDRAYKSKLAIIHFMKLCKSFFSEYLLNNCLPFPHFFQFPIMSSNHIFTEKNYK